VRSSRRPEDAPASAAGPECDLDAARALLRWVVFPGNVAVFPPRVVAARTGCFDPAGAVFFSVCVVAARGGVERWPGDALGAVGDATASGAAATAVSAGAASVVAPGGGGATCVVTVGAVTVAVVVVGAVTVGVVVVGVVVVGSVTVGVVVVGVVG
jgi:hypothetical protein